MHMYTCVHPSIQSPTLLSINSLTHTCINTQTHTFIQVPIPSPMCLHSHSSKKLIHPHTHSSVCTYTHPLIRAYIYPGDYPFIQEPTHAPIYLLTYNTHSFLPILYPCVHPCIYFSIQRCTIFHSCTCPLSARGPREWRPPSTPLKSLLCTDRQTRAQTFSIRWENSYDRKQRDRGENGGRYGRKNNYQPINHPVCLGHRLSLPPILRAGCEDPHCDGEDTGV